MNPIHRAVHIAARRLTINRCLNFYFRGATFLAVCFAFLAVADRLIYLGFSPYLSLAAALIALLPCTLFLALLHPIGDHAAALAVDARLGLQERLSTALTISSTNLPAERAVVADAARYAENLQVGKHFPYQYPSEVKYLPAAGAVMFLVWWLMPSFDLLEREATALQKEQDRKQVVFEARELEKRIQKRSEKLEKLQSVKSQDLLNEMQKAADDMKKAKDKKEAFLKLSEVGDKIKNRHEELQRLMMSKNRFQPDSMSKMTREMQEAMARGDMETAKRHLDRLMEKLQEDLKKDELSKEQLAQMEQLSRELDNLSRKMEELGQENLADQLKMASLKLNEQDLKKLAEVLKDLDMASQELAQQEMMAQELEALELALEDLELAQDCLSCQARFSEFCPSCNKKFCKTCGTDDCECCGEGQLEKCKFKLALTRGGGGGGGLSISGLNNPGGSGNGQGGGSGRGSGLRQRGGLDAAGFEKSRVKGELGEGPVLGVFMVKGQPPKGESKVEYKSAVTNYKAAAEEALDKERIPANYRSLVRDYFNAIENPVVDQGGD